MGSPKESGQSFARDEDNHQTSGNILYLDLASGASGDKLFAALLQVAEETNVYFLDSLRRELEPFVPEVRISTERVRRAGLGGSHLVIEADYSPKHRYWKDIREEIRTSDLPGKAKEKALATFERIAQAEAQVHDVSCEEVHFHEVGAVDSLVDVIGTCLLFDALGASEVVTSPIAVGSGTVECDHGTLPVPVPAVGELLRGAPLFSGAASGELTTPTGAALVMEHSTSWGPMPSLSIEAIGYGAGTRELDTIPNILRAVLGAPLSGSQKDELFSAEGMVLLETNIDHISAEEISFASAELFKEGALDVWQTPIMMKKGRVATKLSALARPADREKITSLMIRATGSLGIRAQWVERTCAPREQIELDTPFGSCRFKVSTLGDKKTIRPEHDDIARIAAEQNLPYREVAQTLADHAKQNLLDI